MMNNYRENYTVYENPTLKESYRSYRHPSGLDIYIFPKNMSSIYAIFGTKYGSINNKFKLDGDDEWTVVPDGIAHFLEHKLFTEEDGSDAFERFSEYGADANAYTSFNRTCYLFSCTERFDDSLSELIEFVTHPYFTEESVKAEIGIIAEEISMYDDNPSDRCFYGMLEGMYEHHSIRRNICGTKETISKITPKLLYDCYNAFYRLPNMALVICGSIDYEQTLDIIDRNLPIDADTRRGALAANENSEEPSSVYLSRVIQKMQVAKPMFRIGIKDTDIPSSGIERQKKDVIMTILDEMLFSDSGKLYAYLLDNDLISPSFSYGYSISDDFAYNSISGESDDPEAVFSAIFEYVDRIFNEGLDKKDFERCKRIMYADAIRSFDSTENIANNLFNFACDECDLLLYAEIIDSVTYDDICRQFKEAFNKDKIMMSVVFPIKKED